MKSLKKLLNELVEARNTYSRELSNLGFDPVFRNLKRFLKTQAEAPVFSVKATYVTLGGRLGRVERLVIAHTMDDAMQYVENLVKKRKRFAGKFNSHAVKVKKVA
jgi:hypothetical protein